MHTVNVAMRFQGLPTTVKQLVIVKLATVTVDGIAIIFLLTAFFLQRHFETDGFGQAADALQFAPVSEGNIKGEYSTCLMDLRSLTRSYGVR